MIHFLKNSLFFIYKYFAWHKGWIYKHCDALYFSLEYDSVMFLSKIYKDITIIAVYLCIPINMFYSLHHCNSLFWWIFFTVTSRCLSGYNFCAPNLHLMSFSVTSALEDNTLLRFLESHIRKTCHVLLG